MRRMTKLGIVWSVIILIVMMPVSFALTIQELQVYGGDQVDGFRKKSDITEVKAVVYDSNPSVSVTPDMVKFSSGLQFDSCSNEAEGVVCRYRSAFNTMFNQNQFTVGVKLYDQYGGTADQKSKTVVIDEKPPVFETAVVKQLEDGNVMANLKVKDFAFTGDSTTCSGLKQITIKDSGTSLVTIGEEDFYGCEYNNPGILLPITQTGERTIVFIAEDRMGHSANLKRVVNIDKSGPTFEEVRILNQDGQQIDFIKGDVAQENQRLKVAIVIKSEDGLKELAPGMPDVSAKFWDFHYAVPEQIGINPSCSMLPNNRYLCEFNNIEVRLSSSQNVYVQAMATDTFENSMDERKTYQLKVDNAPPEILYFGVLDDVTDDEGNPWLGKQATFVLEYFDAGVGVDGEKVKANLQSYSRRSSDTLVIPDELPGGGYCEGGKCYWKRTIGDDVNSNIGVQLYPLSDMVGNTVNSDPKYYRIDRVAPVENVTPVYIREHSYQRTSYFKQGDYIDVDAYIIEKGIGLGEVRLNLSEFSDLAATPGNCQPMANEDSYWCKWENVGPLDYPRPGGADVQIDVSDKVGNKLVIKKRLSVLREMGRPVDIWKDVKVYDDDYVMDREIMSIFPLPIKIPFVLADSKCKNNFNWNRFNCSSQLENVHVIETEFKSAGCKVIATNEHPDGKDLSQDELGYYAYFDPNGPYVGAPYAEDTPGNDRLKIANVRFMPSDGPDHDWITYNCSLIIRSNYMGELQEEMEGFIFNLSFTHSNLGTVPDALKYEIQNARNRASGFLWETIDFLGGIVTMVQSICGIYTTLSSGFMALSFIVQVLHNSIFLKGVGASLGAGMESAKYPVLESIDNIFGPICRFINCQHCQYDSGSFFLPAGNQLDLNDPDVCGGFAGTDQCFEDGFDLCCLLRYPMCMATVGDRTWNNLMSGSELGNVFEVDTSLNPKDSFFLSLFTLCIPGIITNLQKLRHIDCQYILCLEQDVPQGTDPNFCKVERGFSLCIWWGEGLMFLLEMIPGFNILDEVGKLMEEFIKHPAGMLLGLAYKVMCTGPCIGGFGCSVCSLIQIGDNIMEVVNTIWNFADNWDDSINSVWAGSPCTIVFNETEDEGGGDVY